MSIGAGDTPLAERQGWTGALDAVVVSCVWVGKRLAICDGEGRITWIDPELPRIEPQPGHEGAVLAAAAIGDSDALITGGDDGRLIRHAADGERRVLAHFPGRWIEHLALSPVLGLGIAAVDKEAIVFDLRTGAIVRQFAQPSSIGGLALDPKGRRAAVAHYGGVTLWWLGIEGGNPRRLDWQGSHLAVTWSTDGRFVVSAMQEAMLHGWRLGDGADMRMSGYSVKMRAFAWSVKGRWLATGGAPQAVCWPFAGHDGPMGRHPLQRGTHGLSPGRSIDGSDSGDHAPLVARVAFHPKEDILAVGYDDGCVELIRLADGSSLAAVAPDGEAVSDLVWNRGGSLLACGSESGRIVVIRISGATGGSSR